jgi:hypothetical protein
VVNPSTAFLSSLGKSEISLIQNVILAEIRPPKALSTEPNAVMERVKASLHSRESETWTVPMLLRLDQYPEDALALIAHNVARQALPPEERKRQDEASDAVYRREHMAKLEPTQPQLEYLRNLGYEGSIGSRLDASNLIDQIRKAGNN